MPKTATVRARVEPDLKREVEGILNRLGLTASEAILLLYRQIQLKRALPFAVGIPRRTPVRMPHARRAVHRMKRFSGGHKSTAD